MKFGHYLKSCRERSELTQEQLVHELYSFDVDNFSGLDTTMVSRWERGAVAPPLVRKANILRYFQKKTGEAFPCLDSYEVDKIEDLICQEGMKNLIGRKKEYILHFPSKSMKIDDIHIYSLRNFDQMERLIDINMDIHTEMEHPFSQISIEQFREWALHPGNLFLAAEYKNGFVGLLFTLRLKPDIFDMLINFEMKKSDIELDDFAASDEPGCLFVLSFFALNEKAATLLFIRLYAHLMANQHTLEEMGWISLSKEAKKFADSMNLDLYTGFTTEDNVEIESFRQTLPEVLASENMVKMLFAKQEDCPEA